MSQNIPSAFVTQYEAEFTHTFQSGGSLLSDAVTLKRGVTGNTVRFPIMGAALVSRDRNRHSFLMPQNIGHGYADQIMSKIESPDIIDNLDEFMTNIDTRRGYSEAITKALGRDMDLLVLEACNASHTSIGAAAAMDKTRVNKARKGTWDNEWPDAKMTWVITPAVAEKMFGISEYVSRDQNNTQPMTAGKMTPFMGFDFVVLKALEGFKNGAADHRTFIIHQQGVGLGIGKDPAVRIDYSADRGGHVILGQALAGAKTIEANRVLRVDVNGL